MKYYIISRVEADWLGINGLVRGNETEVVVHEGHLCTAPEIKAKAREISAEEAKKFIKSIKK